LLEADIVTHIVAGLVVLGIAAVVLGIGVLPVIVA
jgi:hypothetical protein